MKMDRRSLIGFFFVIALSMLIVDRMSKMWAASNLELGKTGFDFGPIAFTLVHNEGAAFGMGVGGGMVFVGIALVITAAIVIYIFKSKTLETIEVIALGLVVAGALGNLIDRVTTVYVVDFIEFTFISFPVFNVADICVVCGVALLIGTMFARVRSDQQEIYKELEAKSAEKRAREQAAAKARAERIEREQAMAAGHDDPSWGDDDEWERAERERLDKMEQQGQ